MRRAAVAVTFVEIFDAQTVGDWEGRYGAISDLVRYHEVHAGSHKMFEGTVHALDCMLSHGALSLLKATDTLQSMDQEQSTHSRTDIL